MRYLLTILTMGLLTACQLGEGTPGVTPTEEVTPSPASGADATDGMTASCEEAWAEVDVTDVETADDLDAIADQLDVTLENCPSVADWLDEAANAIPAIEDTADIEGWAADRCSEDDTLSEAPVCVEINT